MRAYKHSGPDKMGLNHTPVHPDYQDEISKEQLDAIRKLADPDGCNAKKRILLYPEPW